MLNIYCDQNERRKKSSFLLFKKIWKILIQEKKSDEFLHFYLYYFISKLVEEKTTKMRTRTENGRKWIKPWENIHLSTQHTVDI